MHVGSWYNSPNDTNDTHTHMHISSECKTALTTKDTTDTNESVEQPL